MVTRSRWLVWFGIIGLWRRDSIPFFYGMPFIASGKFLNTSSKCCWVPILCNSRPYYTCFFLQWVWALGHCSSSMDCYPFLSLFLQYHFLQKVPWVDTFLVFGRLIDDFSGWQFLFIFLFQVLFRFYGSPSII